MTPVLLLAGVVILVVIAIAGLYALGHREYSQQRLRIKITLVPPSLDFYIEQRSD